ncbi:winged helix-turn-helix domain-containing protein [Chania multitudinisentens]|uniref:winged helix-turn-helix domain-containing protein n=1 Tax=Chania multitudinisentens TaxID=1639108 RepID=UPI0003E151A1|nr:helix-turn-helix domain-containing protein [Chania multitudinisentens]
MNAEKGIKIRNLDVLIPSRKKSRLRWKEYQILSLLVARSPELVSRSEIIENIWKGTYCSDSTINQTIKSIRQKIGDNGHTIIRTIPRLGYKVENKAIFHFITEEDVFVPDDPWLNEKMSEDDIQSEPSEIECRGDDEIDEEMCFENNVLDDVIQPDAFEGMNKASVAHEPQHASAFSPFPLNRAMKYLTVFVSFLVISHLFYVLGNQNRQPVGNNIQYSPHLVLSLTLNGSRSSYPQTLICLYQEGSAMEMRIECIDPESMLHQEPMKYKRYTNYYDDEVTKLPQDKFRARPVVHETKS